MRSRVTSNQFTDADGNPAGGTTFGQGFCIGWQNGPLGRGDERREPNGAFVEDIIAAALNRLVFYQQSRFACDANAVAIAHLTAALDELQARTAEREKRAVEGTHAV
jgi:hypothetical protein